MSPYRWNLWEVVEPHPVRDRAKYESLLSAYGANRFVPPVVVMVTEHEALALTGSHRIAAMRDAYGGATWVGLIEEYVILIEWEKTWAVLELDPDEAFSGDNPDRFHETTAALLALPPETLAALDPHLRAALEDQ